MIKYRKDYKYVCSTEGTEQILPTNESDVTSLSPVMDITYGNGGELLEDQHFTYRQTAGGEVSDIPENVATVQAIRGQSVVWNQLVQNGNFSENLRSWSSTGTSTRSVSNNVLTMQSSAVCAVYQIVTGKILENHIYLIRANISATQSTSFGVYKNSSSWKINSITTDGTKRAILSIFKAESILSTDTFDIRIRCNDTNNNTVTVADVTLFDLTLMFGAGNEPATVEEFEAWLAANVGLRDYYPYDAGTILNVKSTGIKTTGFNQWDEEWEAGMFLVTDGTPMYSNERTRSKNKINCLPETTYYYSCNTGSYTGNLTILFYDANGGYISYYNFSSEHEFTTPANCHFMTFFTGVSYGTTYNHDICINISDPNKNGTYEPYFESTLPMEVTSMTGKLNGAGQSVTIFPDGMNQVGDIYDEIYVEDNTLKAVKRLGVVDMGALTWSIDSSGRFMATLTGKANGYNNIICNKYTVPTSSEGSAFADKQIKGTTSTNQILVKDSSYSDAATFKTAMSGVMLVYELNTPEEYIVDVHKDLTRRIINANDVQKVYIGNDLIWEKPVLE